MNLAKNEVYISLHIAVCKVGLNKMWSGADLRARSPLASCNHVTDPRFVIFSSCL